MSNYKQDGMIFGFEVEVNSDLLEIGTIELGPYFGVPVEFVDEEEDE